MKKEVTEINAVEEMQIVEPKETVMKIEEIGITIEPKIAPTKRTKVAIVGFAPSWTSTPFADPEFEIWTLNEAYKLFSTRSGARADRWFEIHDPNSPTKSSPEHLNWLKTCKIPLYMQKHSDEYPSSVEYPREQIKTMFGENFIVNDVGAPFRDYSNSISWMIALAIYEGFKEIWVMGVDMAQKSEYAFQRASCQFFIGYAAGKGIKLLIPKNSELCKFPMDYGFETDNQIRHFKKARKKDLQTRKKNMLLQLQQMQNQMQEMQLGMAQIDGAVSEIDYDLSNHIV